MVQITPIQRIRARSEAQTILGLSGQPSEDDIRRAYKAKVFASHPDHADGSNETLSLVNAAYEFLVGRREDLSGFEEQTPRAAPIRPAIQPRTVRIDEVTRHRAERLVAEKAGTDGRNHIAFAVRKAGRRLTYLVATELELGRNKVALPAEILASPPRNMPKLVSFRTNNRGQGRICVPKARVALDFPGASEVVVLFGVADT